MACQRIDPSDDEAFQDSAERDVRSGRHAGPKCDMTRRKTNRRPRADFMSASVLPAVMYGACGDAQALPIRMIGAVRGLGLPAAV